LSVDVMVDITIPCLTLLI